MLIRTASGQPLSVRPLQRSDARLLVRFFHTLSPQTRWQRFFRTLVGVSPQWVRQEARLIAQRDGTMQTALVALTPPPARSVIVAGAQLVRAAPGDQTAELALVVCDAYQHQGVGGHLLRLLLARGRAEGITRISATMYADNTAMWRSLVRLGLPITSSVHMGERSVLIELEPAV